MQSCLDNFCLSVKLGKKLVVYTCTPILVFLIIINFEDNFLGQPLSVSMKFILIKLPDQQQKKTNNTFSHISSL